MRVYNLPTVWRSRIQLLTTALKLQCLTTKLPSQPTLPEVKKQLTLRGCPENRRLYMLIKSTNLCLLADCSAISASEKYDRSSDTCNRHNTLTFTTHSIVATGTTPLNTFVQLRICQCRSDSFFFTHFLIVHFEEVDLKLKFTCNFSE